jgi:hypothetical protein
MKFKHVSYELLCEQVQYNRADIITNTQYDSHVVYVMHREQLIIH